MKSKKYDTQPPFDFAEKVGVALRLAVADAIEEHRRSGHPLAIWQSGRVVLLPPDQAAMPDPPRKKSGRRHEKL